MWGSFIYTKLSFLSKSKTVKDDLKMKSQEYLKDRGFQFGKLVAWTWNVIIYSKAMRCLRIYNADLQS